MYLVGAARPSISARTVKPKRSQNVQKSLIVQVPGIKFLYSVKRPDSDETKPDYQDEMILSF